MSDSATGSTGTPDSRASLLRQIFGLAVPLMGGQASAMAMPVFDGALCGHLDDGGLSLAALGFTFQVWYFIQVAVQGLDVGTVAVVSRAHGAGDRDRIARLAAQSVLICLVTGGLLTALGVVLGRPVLGALGADGRVAELGAEYLAALMIGLPAIFLTEGCLAAVMRSVGNSRTPVLCDVIADVVKVVLTYALMFGHLGLPALGLVGAGLATSISRYVSLGLMIVLFRRAEVIKGRWFRLGRGLVDRPAMREILRVGLPTSLQQMIFFGSITMLVFFLAHVAQEGVAAHGIGARLFAFLTVASFGLSSALAALVGASLGAGSVERARRLFRLSLGVALGIMVPIAVVTFVGAHQILDAYDVPRGSLLEDYALTWLRLLAVALVLQPIMACTMAVLLGAGSTRAVMKVSVTTTVLLQVPLAGFLCFGTDLGAAGVWLSWPITLALQSVLYAVIFRRGTWAVTGVHAAGS